jgi:hypothetical protein
MAQEKVDASRHNARTTSLDNPSPGSKHPEPPSLIGGGGGSTNLSILNSSKLDGTPPPIKERDYCKDFSCGDPFTFHLDPIAQRQHVKSWFANSQGDPYSEWWLNKSLGVETVNEIIQVYRVKEESLEASGKEVNNRPAFFHYCRNLVVASMEPRPEAGAADKAWAALKPKKKPKDDRNKYLAEKIKRTGRQ